MHPAVFEELADTPSQPHGRVFHRWSDRVSVYRVLNPLCERLGIRFTPHMARHDFASALNETNASAKDIMSAGTWTSERSVSRYIDVSMARAREVISRLPGSGKNSGKRQRTG